VKQQQANFFLIGAAKAGTTSIYNYLQQHPDVFLSPVKEPNYFSKDIDVSKFTPLYKKNNLIDPEEYFNHKPLKPLHLTFIRKPAHYQMLFGHVQNESVIGECSTSYLYSQLAAKNIFQYNPKAKIVAVLRNPVERAFSHYLMALRYGYTSLSFRQALEKDISKEPKGWGISELFIELGLYYEQLKRYFDIFPSDQIKIIIFDDFRNASEMIIHNLFDFLDIKKIELQEISEKHQAKSPKYPKLNNFASKTGLKKAVKSISSNTLVHKMVSGLYSEKKVEICKEDKTFLLNIFLEDIEKTSQLIKRDLKMWLKI